MPYVLLLEDVDSDAHEVESALKQIGGYEVQRFIAASRAIETLSDALSSGSDLPDLIIVDLNLPGSSGYELLRFYHATPKLRSVPCAVWTVLSTHIDKKLTTWMGSKKFISKHSGPATLRKSLASLLQTGAGSRQNSA
jgi:CheY-like chemotaxis protein